MKAHNAAKASKSLQGILLRVSRRSLATTTAETLTLDSRKNSSASDAPTFTTSTTTSTYCASSTSSFPAPQLPPPSQHSLSIWDAEEFIREFINDYWSNHAAYIKIDCDLTLDELHALGRLPKDAGLLACGRLIRVPAIHEEVAASLWERLVEAAPALAPSAEMTMATEEGIGRKKSVNLTVLKETKHSVKKFLRQQNRRCREDERTTASSVRCPFCSGRCVDYHAPPISATPAKLKNKKQEEPSWQLGEDDFWQREDPWLASRRSSAATQTTTTTAFSGSCSVELTKGNGWGKWLGRVGKDWWCERVSGMGESRWWWSCQG